jgi:hypothetical protein
VTITDWIEVGALLILTFLMVGVFRLINAHHRNIQILLRRNKHHSDDIAALRGALGEVAKLLDIVQQGFDPDNDTTPDTTVNPIKEEP